MANQKLLNKIWFFYISFLILWVILTWGDTIVAFLNDKIFCYRKDGQVFTSDFILYYNNGVLAWDALKDGINIYDGLLQNQYLEKLTGFKLKKIFYSQYPPYLFVLNMPLPLVKMKIAWIFWELLGLILLITSIWGLLKISLKGKFTRTFTYTAVLASFPGWFCFRLGQIALFIYPAFIWYWLALERKKWFTAGILGGFCLLKLQYAPILFLTGILLGGLRFFWGYATMGMIYLLSSGFILGWHNVLGYPQALKYGEISGKVTGVAPEDQQNIRGQLVAILHNDDTFVHAIAFIAWMAASFAIAYFWYKESRLRKSLGEDDPGQKRRFLLLSSVTVIVLLLSSPHTHKQDFIFMSLPCIWLMYMLVGEYPIKEAPISGDFKPVNLLSIRYLILGFPMLSWLFFLLAYYLPVIIQPFFAWGVILLFAIILLIISCGGVEKISSSNLKNVEQ